MNRDPVVSLTLEIHSSVARLLENAGPHNSAVAGSAARSILRLMAALGIPGQASVKLASLASDAVRPGQLLRVVGNGQACGCPNDMLNRIYSVARGRVLAPPPKAQDLITWLTASLAADSGDADRAAANNFLSLACAEAVKRRPLMLFGPQQRTAYTDYLQELSRHAFTAQERNTIEQSLAVVVDLSVPIGRHEAVCETVRSGLDQGKTAEDIAEELISALILNTVDVAMPRDYLKRLAKTDTGEGHDKIPQVREDLFYELGLRYPEFRFVPSDELAAGCFAFTINNVTSLPWVGLSPEQYIVNSSPRVLAGRTIDAAPALNPVSGGEWSIVDDSHKAELEQAGMAVRNAMAWIAWCMRVELRHRSAAFVHRQLAAEQLKGLEQAVPDLIKAARERFSLEQITRVLRGLAAEDVSMRNLRLILQSMIDCDYVATDPAKYIILDDRLPFSGEPQPAWNQDARKLTSQVRSSLKRYLSHKYTRGRNTLAVHLVAPEIEQLLASEGTGEGGLSPEQQLKLLRGVAAKYDNQPAGGPLPAILTTIEVRPALRALLAHDFPEIPVMAYQELAPDINIQPISRISLE
jgi:type III secretion protein V